MFIPFTTAMKQLLAKSQRVLQSLASPFRKETEQPASRNVAPASTRQAPDHTLVAGRDILTSELRAMLPTLLKDLLVDPSADPELTRALRAAMLGRVLPMGAGMACGSVSSSGTNVQNMLTKWSSTACALIDSLIYDDGANLGIGTTNPQAKFNLHGSGAAMMLSGSGSHSYALASGDSDPYATVNARFGNETGGPFISSDINDYALKFYLKYSNSLTERFRIAANGNVGVGTTSPQGILDITGRTVYLTPSPSGDDTNQINGVINNLASAGGGILFFTPGVYMVGNLDGASNVHLHGVGIGASILRFKSGSSGSILTYSNKTNFSVRDLTFDCNNVAYVADPAGPAAISAGVGSKHFDISDCEVINTNRFGITLQGCEDFRVQRNYIEISNPAPDKAKEAIILFGGALSSNGVIESNYCKYGGIEVYARNLAISNNIVEGVRFGMGIVTEQDHINPTTHLREFAQWGIEIIGNTLFGGRGLDSNDTLSGGIENWVDKTVISGNVIYDNVGPGISQGGRGCSVVGNVIFNNGGTATNTSGQSVAAHSPAISIPCYSTPPVGNPPDRATQVIFAGSDSVISGNRCFDDRSTKYQSYGVSLGVISDPYSSTGQYLSAENVSIISNNLSGNEIGEYDIPTNSQAYPKYPSGNIPASVSKNQSAICMIASSTQTAGLRLPPGTDPSSPTQGDIWINGEELKWRGVLATQQAERQSNKNVANGYAGLDASGQVQTAQVPGLDASKITGGVLSLSRGGTGVACNGILNSMNGQKKVKFGNSQLSNGSASVNTGLTTVDFCFASLVYGGAPPEYLSRANPSGGTVVFYSSDTASNDYFDWMAIGS